MSRIYRHPDDHILVTMRAAAKLALDRGCDFLDFQGEIYRIDISIQKWAGGVMIEGTAVFQGETPLDNDYPKRG